MSKAWKYTSVYIIPLVIFLSLWSGDFRAFAALIFTFGFIPLIELFLDGTEDNMNEVEEELAKDDRLYDLILYSLVPVQLGLMIFFLIQIDQEGIGALDKLALTSAFGISCGVIGINGAHELGHRFKWYEQLMSKTLLLSSLYTHFFIEHNRGHHRNVATQEDPSSGRFGEVIYLFYIRTIVMSFISAWHLAAEQMRRENRSIYSWRNEMIQFTLAQLVLLAVIYATLGWQVTLWFCLAAIFGILLLETVNYIEHYGLQRKRKANGYERTMPHHSWNSNHPLGRLMLLELSRHSDHHFISSRKFQILRHHDNSPQMPTGYPGMMLLSLVPPLWFRVMHPLIDRYTVEDTSDKRLSIQ